MAEAVIIPYLRNQGLKSLDKIIISHSDNDHAGGIKYLQEQLTVNSVIANIDKKYFTPTPIQE
jgi:competence protein ComEC